MVQLLKHHVNFSHFYEMQIFNLTTFITLEHLSISLACFPLCFSSTSFYIHLVTYTILRWKGLHSSYRAQDSRFKIIKRRVILDGITHLCTVHTRIAHTIDCVHGLLTPPTPPSPQSLRACISMHVVVRMLC